MKNIFKILILLIFIQILSSCQTTQTGDSQTSNDLYPNYKLPEKYNFKFIGIDSNIINPENDRRSYYKITIDKIDAGLRSSIGLESQEKVFVTTLSSNRHLLTIEKYKLDDKKGKYVKLNNIEQPKPAFTYFEVPEGRIVTIKLIQDRINNKSEFIIDYEYE